ncbi:MAG: ATP-binding protein, partial [Cyanobacteria bacterium J06641_5]
PSADRPLVRQHPTPDGEVTDVFVPLEREGEPLGVMAVGINPNPTVVASSHLTRDVTIAVFISIWAMVILGVVLNALTITRPIKELLQGVRNIAAGRFRQRIELPLGGELGELIVSFNDMAERLANYEEQNIEELTAEKAKLDILVTTIADGAILLDPDLQVVLANPTARRLFDWEGRDLQGKSVVEHLPAAIAAEIAQPLKELLANPENLRNGKDTDADAISCDELRVTLAGVHERTARILLSRVRDQYRTSVKGIAMTVQDVTREVELNKAKSQFISNVSHELRTPLFNIKSFIETLHEYGEDLSEVERREFLQITNSETDRLTRLVNDVLDLSRLDSSKVYQMGAVELTQPIEQTLRTCHLNARDKGIEIGCEIEANLPAVVGNYDLLLQVFANLVGNALKFTRTGGRVAIRAERAPQNRDRLVRIEVADTGIGIDATDREAIFDRFFRVENQVHTLEGTGLGLSIVRNIIDKHQSHIQIISEVGTGTTFWFDLGIYQENASILPHNELTTNSLPPLPVCESNAPTPD